MGNSRDISVTADAIAGGCDRMEQWLRTATLSFSHVPTVQASGQKRGT